MVVGAEDDVEVPFTPLPTSNSFKEGYALGVRDALNMATTLFPDISPHTNLTRWYKNVAHKIQMLKKILEH